MRKRLAYCIALCAVPMYWCWDLTMRLAIRVRGPLPGDIAAPAAEPVGSGEQA